MGVMFNSRIDMFIDFIKSLFGMSYKNRFNFDHRSTSGMQPFHIKRFSLVAITVFVLVVLYSSFFVYIHPNEYGIKEVKVGIHRGIRNKIYEAGYTFVIPFVNYVYIFPRDIQVLELTASPSTASRVKHFENAAHIQTSDGFYVDVDCSILYKVHDAYKVITTLGPGRLFESNGIIPKAEPILKETLGELTTEDFYNSPLRVEKVKIAKELLNKDLESKGLHVEQILVRYFRYSSEIQKNIEEKKLKDQLVFKNIAEAHAATEGAKLKKIIEEGEVNVRIRLEEGKAYVVERNADRELYVRKKNAEADLLVKLADAKKIELKNDALIGAGSDRMIGLKMADVYKGMNLIILPSDGANAVNPLDVNKSMRLFGVR